MAKTVEPYEEDDFLLEEQNSVEEPAGDEEEIDETSTLRVRPRPARASLTHSAIKSEILKMNKQQNRQDSPSEDNEENMSRSARKRRKRREKVLEERRASGGRGENFEDDLAHFKSIPISRRRSSVLPLQTISLPNYNNDESICSKLKCFMWILLVAVSLIGFIYVWPTVAEIDLEMADQVTVPSANELPIQQTEQTSNINRNIESDEQIIDQMNKVYEALADEPEDNNQVDGNQNVEEESLGTLDYISSFFASEPITEQPEEQSDENVNNNVENNANNEDYQQVFDEERIEPTTTTTADNDGQDEGFDETGEANEENDEQQNVVEQGDNLADSIPERYQTSVHQDETNEQEQSCVIGGLVYNNLDNEQCNLLQVRQQQLEQQLREQEQLIRQEQQANANNEEQFYFF